MELIISKYYHAYQFKPGYGSACFELPCLGYNSQPFLSGIRLPGIGVYEKSLGRWIFNSSISQVSLNFSVTLSTSEGGKE